MSTAIESSWKRDQLGALIKKRHSLYHQGDRVHYPTADDTPYCYKVLKGTILLSRDGLDSNSTVLGIVDPGRLFGEEAQFGIPRSHDAVAAVETVVQRVLITSEVIETLLKDLMHRSNFLEQLFLGKYFLSAALSSSIPCNRNISFTAATFFSTPTKLCDS